MQKNPMNKNREEKSMSSRTTPTNLNQRTNEKMRKANKSISNKGIQKCTTLQMSFLYASWFFLLRNLSLLKVGEGVEVEVLWALVFLTIMLRIKRQTQKRERKNRETKDRLQVSTKNIEITILYDAWTV